MCNEPVLRTLIVVRGHEEQRIRPDLLRILRELDRIGSFVRAGSRHDGDTPLNLLHRKADGLAVFRIRHRRRLACRPRNDDGIRTARNLIVNDTSEFGIIYACFRKRRDNGNAGTTENRLFHGSSPFSLSSAIIPRAA